MTKFSSQLYRFYVMVGYKMNETQSVTWRIYSKLLNNKYKTVQLDIMISLEVPITKLNYMSTSNSLNVTTVGIYLHGAEFIVLLCFTI